MRFSPLYLLAALFLVVSPLSAASELSLVSAAKYVRLGSTILMVILGLTSMGNRRLGICSSALITFAAVYVVAAVWSTSPVLGLAYKSTFGLCVLSGVLLAYESRNRLELTKGLRLLTVVAAVAAVVAFVIFLRNPEDSLRLERLSILGLNANRIGQTASPLLILTAYPALHDPKKFWRAVALVASVLLAWVMLRTGSRASFAMSVIGCLFVALPLTKRPSQLMGVAVVLAVISFGVLQFDDSFSVDRLGSTNDTRSSAWSRSLSRMQGNPLIGQGWVNSGNKYSTSNLLNIYLQTYVEAGLLGCAVLGVSIFTIVARAREVYGYLSRYPDYGPLAALALGIVAAILTHGLAESGTLLGSTVNSLVLGFGVGLLDRLPVLASEEYGRKRRVYRVPRAAAPRGRRPVGSANTIAFGCGGS